MTVADFQNLLKNKFKMNHRNINFSQRDLQQNGLVVYIEPQPQQVGVYGWRLTNIGFELVRYELIEKKKREQQNNHEGLMALAELLQARPGVGLLGKSIQPKKLPNK